MYAVAGAILINAACILMASAHDSFDIYVSQRVLMAIGAMMLTADLFLRARAAIQKAKVAAGKSSSTQS